MGMCILMMGLIAMVCGNHEPNLLRTQTQNWPLGEYIWYYNTTASIKIIAKWSKKLSRAKIGSKLVRHPPDPRKWQHKDPMWQIY